MNPLDFDYAASKSSLSKVSEGFSLTADIPSSQLSSFLFPPSQNESDSCQLVVITAVVGVFETGYYSFRMSDDCDLVAVCDCMVLND